jgi:peptide/nickel transport system ATP-binding protein
MSDGARHTRPGLRWPTIVARRPEPRLTESGETLGVTGLTVEVEASGAAIVEGLDLVVRKGEILGLVGESGSGKTTTALALLGYAARGTRIAGGQLTVGGVVLDAANTRLLRKVRGRIVSYVPQDPALSLNPALRIEGSINDILKTHLAAEERPSNPGEILSRVHLPGTREFSRRYPHQLSGGQQQRVLIGMALMCRPPVVVLDEPTTGLDVVTQATILDEIRYLRRELGIGMVYVSHDLAVVGSIADRIAVMYAGRIVEEGPATEVLKDPRHPYTRGLVASIPDIDRPSTISTMPGVAVTVGKRPAGCAFAPRCAYAVDECQVRMPPLDRVAGNRTVRCIRWQEIAGASDPRLPRVWAPRREGLPLMRVEELTATHGQGRLRVVAADTVSFGVMPGECVALVGESGSGKTTIARCVAGLHVPASGAIFLGDERLPYRAQRRTLEARRRIQLISQNPYESLNPRQRVIDQIARPAQILRRLSRREAREEAARLLERVRLPSDLGARFPSDLSGGERQRVAIARALSASPDLLVCDEVTSALDVSVQGAILNLLSSLRQELDVALLLITHDLGVVATVADYVLVLEAGSLREEGRPDSVLQDPKDAYARRLLEAVPRLPPRDIDADSRTSGAIS